MNRTLLGSEMAEIRPSKASEVSLYDKKITLHACHDAQKSAIGLNTPEFTISL